MGKGDGEQKVGKVEKEMGSMLVNKRIYEGMEKIIADLLVFLNISYISSSYFTIFHIGPTLVQCG